MTARKAASRREILQVAAAGVAGLGLGRHLTSNTSNTSNALTKPAVDVEAAQRPATATSAREDAESYLGDLVGEHLGRYRVVSIGKLERGGIPVVMSVASGATFRVDVLRFDPTEGRQGIGAASSVSVYLRNGGDGRKATDEEHGLGAMALANTLARREKAGTKPPSGLLTMDERAAYDASLT